jgi:hypothetical protein
MSGYIGGFERPGLALDLGQQQAALQGGERGEGQVVRVRAGGEVAAGVPSAAGTGGGHGHRVVPAPVRHDERSCLLRTQLPGG